MRGQWVKVMLPRPQASEVPLRPPACGVSRGFQGSTQQPLGREHSPLQRGVEGRGNWEADANEDWGCFPREMVIFIDTEPPGAWGSHSSWSQSLNNHLNNSSSSVCVHTVLADCVQR